ncbi:MAG: ATP-binding protein [Elusimicrobia bacterium]|nr:ATP-binding protein [Elusimicrobiota bacterium]
MDKSIRILLIEDDPDYTLLMNLYINEACGQAMKHEMENAVSLAQGLDLLARRDFDIVLLDLMLPDSQGLDTLAELRRRAPGVPVVVLTNLALEETGLQAIGAGAQDFLIKSKVDQQQLVRTVGYALERSRLYGQMESLVRAAPDGIVIVDSARMVRYANPAALALLNRTAEQVQGRLFEYPLEGDGPSELKLAGPNGEITAEVRLAPVEWRGAAARLVTIRDITELRRIEQVRAEIEERRRMDELKDKMLSTVSHELRTPLSIVKMAVGTIRDRLAGPLTPDQDNMIRTADRNISRLTRILSNFLDLSRLESGSAYVDLRPVDPVEFIREVTDDMRMACKSRNVSLVVDAAADLPQVKADRDMITQVLGNLLDNALRYARQRIEVRAKRIDAEVVVSVVDDGSGIPEGKGADLFNKFIQLDRPRGGEGYKGTGLGLAICREIMNINGGRIWAENVKGLGAGFHFALPVAAPAAASAAASATGGPHVDSKK